MSSTSYTYVYYFVPLDGDTEEHMNVFLIRKPPAEVTVADIESVRRGAVAVSPAAGVV